MDPLLIIMLLAVGAMFLLTSRTRKQQREAAEFRTRLQVGDDVMTASGLFGTIVDIDGDVITLESPSGGRTDWLRGAISKLATPPYAAEPEDEAQEDELPEELVQDDDYAEELDDLPEGADTAVLDEDDEPQAKGRPRKTDEGDTRPRSS